MEKEILLVIKNEISKLFEKDYREKEKIWANDKQIKNLNKLFIRTKELNKESVNDFCRYVSDIAPLNSKLSIYTYKLFEITNKD